MDKCDLKPSGLLRSADLRGVVRPLAAGLWAATGPCARSAELSALYVDRFTGPRLPAPAGWHTHWEFTYVFAGQGFLRGDWVMSLERGTALLIPPRLPHSEEAEASLDTLWVGLRGKRLKDVPREGILMKRLGGLAGDCERLWLLAQGRAGRIGPELDALAALIVGQLLRSVEETRPGEAPWIDQAILWMRQRLGRPLSITGMAEQFGYSHGHFHRVFRRRTGKTPACFLTDIRMKQAAQLLRHSSLPVKQVAIRTGFPDPLHFSRVFRKTMGVAPREYRASTQAQTGSVAPG